MAKRKKKTEGESMAVVLAKQTRLHAMQRGYVTSINLVTRTGLSMLEVEKGWEELQAEGTLVGSITRYRNRPNVFRLGGR